MSTTQRANVFFPWTWAAFEEHLPRRFEVTDQETLWNILEHWRLIFCGIAPIKVALQGLMIIPNVCSPVSCSRGSSILISLPRSSATTASLSRCPSALGLTWDQLMIPRESKRRRAPAQAGCCWLWSRQADQNKQVTENVLLPLLQETGLQTFGMMQSHFFFQSLLCRLPLLPLCYATGDSRDSTC